MLNSQVPGEVARHAAAVLLALFLGFLCVYVRLRAREKSTPALPRWTGPVSLGWAITVGCALLLILATFWALNLHHRLSLTELIEVGREDLQGVETDRARRGLKLLKASVLVLPLFAAGVWIGAVRVAKRLESPPGRYASTALWGLLVSAAGLLIFLLVYADRLGA